MINQQFREHLKKYKYYCTPERSQLFNILESQKTPCSIAELIDLTENEMNETTVYRNLDLFEKIGVINRVYSGWRYQVELSDMFSAHHHHMSCTNCGTIISFKESASFLDELKKLEAAHGFSASSHSLELKGLCRNCC